MSDLVQVGFITTHGRLLEMNWLDRRPSKGRQRISEEKWLEQLGEPVYVKREGL